MLCCLIFDVQTMGGTFSGKNQDCTKGIYAMAGRIFLFWTSLGSNTSNYSINYPTRYIEMYSVARS